MSDSKTLTQQEHMTLLIKLYKIIAERLKNLSLEVGAYQLALGAWKVALPQDAQPLDEALTAARRNAGLRERLRQEYDIPLERFLALDAQFQTEEKLWELFSKNSTGLIQ